MKTVKVILIVIFGVSNYTGLFAQMTPNWATAYSVNFPFQIEENDMVTDNNGNVYITGYSHDTSFVNNNVVILKYNSLGQFQWVHDIDSLNYYTKIAVDDSGNIYMAGISDKYLITIKYNPQGIVKWYQCYYSGEYNWVWDIITDDSCNVYITGNSHNDRFTTIKYNSSGNQIWVALDVVSQGLDNSYIALDNDRNVYISFRDVDTNYTCNTIKYNSSGVKQWERIYKGNFIPGGAIPSDIKYDNNGYIYVLTGTYNYNDESDFSVVKYDTSGNQIWASQTNFLSDANIPEAMAIDKFGNAYATGHIYETGGTIDSFATVRFDPQGNIKWTKKYSSGSNHLDEAYAITIDTLGFVYITGRSSLYFTTIKYDSSGNQIWLANYHHSLNSSDDAQSISLDNGGNIYVSGTSYDLNSTSILTIKYSYSVGINEYNNSTTNEIVYPNPFKTSFTINANKDLLDAELKVYNIFGQEVINISHINNNTITIQRNNLNDGMYFYNLIEKNQEIAKGEIIAE